MILNGLIVLLVRVLAPLFDAFLPSLKVSTVPALAVPYMEDMGHYLRFLNPFVTVDVVVTWCTVLAIVLLGRAGYIVFEWVWRHIPHVAGFGT